MKIIVKDTAPIGEKILDTIYEEELMDREVSYIEMSKWEFEQLNYENTPRTRSLSPVVGKFQGYDIRIKG